MSAIDGPASFFATHPVAYSLSLSGAGAATAVFATRAARSSGIKRAGWALLCALEAAIFMGIVTSTESAKRGTKGLTDKRINLTRREADLFCEASGAGCARRCTDAEHLAR